MPEENKFELQIVVDFYDDLLACPWTEATFREMMRTFKEWGITRVYWNGQAYASGLYDAEANKNLDVHALRTFQNVGEFIPKAVQYAHEQGIELYIEFKPFDMYFPLLVPHDMTIFKVRNKERKGIPAVGGHWQMGSIFCEEHPEFLMARNMTGMPKDVRSMPVRTIKLVKSDDKPSRVTRKSITLYTSTDNHHYKPYTRSFQFTDEVVERPRVIKGVNLNTQSTEMEKVRVITLGNLHIREPYLAISTTPGAGTPDFANEFWKLVELYSDDGKPIPFTYGIPSPGADAWYPPDLTDKQFPERGFMFDMSEVMAANDLAYRADDNMGYLDSGSGLIGIAKGKNAYTTTVCPAYPEVHEFWLAQIRQFIEWGVDGVEFRWAAHQDTREWDAYGFNQPVVDEYQKRYGVDILTQDFDRGKWRALLGEYYTQFLAESAALLHSQGKQMMVDVMPSNDPNPAHPQFANICLDWPTWFSFADGVSFKWLLPGAPVFPVFQKTADSFGIPTYPNFWAHVIYKDMTPEQVAQSLKSMQDAGCRGLILYEAAAFMQAQPDGTFKITFPKVPEVIVPAVKAMNAAD